MGQKDVRRSKFYLSLLLVCALGWGAAQPRPIIAATELVQALSATLRTTETSRGKLIYTFQTVYQISGREMLPRSFWRQIRTGARLQLKLDRQFNVWIVKRVNLLEAK